MLVLFNVAHEIFRVTYPWTPMTVKVESVLEGGLLRYVQCTPFLIKEVRSNTGTHQNQEDHDDHSGCSGRPLGWRIHLLFSYRQTISKQVGREQRFNARKNSTADLAGNL